MYIVCPNCQFRREIDLLQIPSNATMATCPKCKERFRFRDDETGDLIQDIFDKNEDIQDINRENSESFQENQNISHSQEENQSISYKKDESVLEKDENKEDYDQRESSQKENKNNSYKKDDIYEDDTHKDGDYEDDTHKDGDYEEEYESDNYEDDTNQRNIKKQAIMEDDVPWEHPDRYGFFGSLYHTVIRVMFRAPEFFKNIHGSDTILKPVLFYALLGLLQAILVYFWSLSAMRVLSEMAVTPESEALFMNLQSDEGMLMLLVSAPFLSAFRLIFYSSFIYLAIKITNPEKASFNLIIRIIAYASAPMVLSAVPYVGPMIGMIWSIVNVFIGIRYALGITWQRTILSLAPLFLLLGFFTAYQVLQIISSLG